MAELKHLGISLMTIQPAVEQDDYFISHPPCEYPGLIVRVRYARQPQMPRMKQDPL